MNKLEVGMYVKINGFISKIHHINTSKKGETYMQFIQPNGLNASMNVKIYDGKPSYDIIDLIEVGDYVNGEKIIDLDLGTTGKTIRLFTSESDINIENIKSIVTKEQFEQMKYEVE